MIKRVPGITPEQTASWIVAQAEKASGDPSFFMLSRYLVRFVREHDRLSEALAIGDFVERSIRYTPDPPSFEVVFSPLLLFGRSGLVWQHGRWSEDCDTLAGSVYAFLRSIGHAVRIVIAGFSVQEVIWEHIFCQTAIGGLWVTVDPAEKYLTPSMLQDVRYIKIFGGK